MFGLQVLDIGLGLIFLYLVLSLTCTAATEMLAGFFRLGAKTLEEGIGNLLRDPVMKERIFNHPLIRDLYR
jgi:hypothetical protein